jgi:hypothetical protein
MQDLLITVLQHMTARNRIRATPDQAKAAAEKSATRITMRRQV